jgi:ADP-heptose:LPS heptosyltransferase
MPMDHDKALLIYSGWLGDFVWIVPTVKALKRRFASVSMVVSGIQSTLAGAFEGTLLDEVFADTKSGRRKFAAMVRRSTGEMGIGTFIDIKGRAKAGMYVPWRRGIKAFMPSHEDAREYLLARMLHPSSHVMPRREPGRHMVESYLAIAGFFGAPQTPVNFDIEFDEATRREADRVVEREELGCGRTVALNLGSAQFSKIWPASSFRKLAEILESDLCCKVVVMGAKCYKPNNDYDMAASSRCFSDGRFTDLVAETGQLVDSCLLRGGVFDVCVGNDSFAGHMAGSANEVPAGAEGAARASNGKWYRANRTVTLFGPTNPMYCRPYDPTGKFNLAVHPDSYPATCSYDREAHICRHYRDRYCVDRKEHCMAEISVEQVAGAVATQLATAKAGD